MKLSDLNTTLGNRDSTSGVRLSDYVYGGVNIPDVKLNADTGLTVASSKKLSTFTNILSQLTALELTNVTFGNSDFNVGVGVSGSVDVTLTFNHTLNGSLGVLPTNAGSQPVRAGFFNLSTNVGGYIIPAGYIGQSSASKSVSVPVSFSISDESLTSKYIQVDAEDYLSVGVSSFTKYLSFYADRYVYNLSWVQEEQGLVNTWGGYNQAYFSWAEYNAGNCTPPYGRQCIVGTNAKGCNTYNTAVHFDCGINCRHPNHGIESTIWNEGTSGSICGQDSWSGLKHTASNGETCFTTVVANDHCNVVSTVYLTNYTLFPQICTTVCVGGYNDDAITEVLGVSTDHPAYPYCYPGVDTDYAWVCFQPMADGGTECVPGNVCAGGNVCVENWASNNDGYSGAEAPAAGYGCTAGYNYSSCVAALGTEAGCADCTVADTYTYDPCASTYYDPCASTYYSSCAYTQPTYTQYNCSTCTITAAAAATWNSCLTTQTTCVNQTYTGVPALNPEVYPGSPGCESCIGYTDKTCRSSFFNVSTGYATDYESQIYNMSTATSGSSSCTTSSVEATGVSCATAANGCLVFEKCKWCLGSLISNTTVNTSIGLTDCVGPWNSEATPANVNSSSFTVLDTYESSQGWLSSEYVPAGFSGGFIQDSTTRKTLSWWFHDPNIANDVNPNITPNLYGLYSYNYATDTMAIVTAAKITQPVYNPAVGSCIYSSLPGTIESNQSLTTSNATNLAEINAWQTSTLITAAEQQLFANMEQYNLSYLQSDVISALDGLVLTPTLNSTDIGYKNVKPGSVSITLGAAGSN